MWGSAQNEFDELCSSVAPRLPTRKTPRQDKIPQGLPSVLPGFNISITWRPAPNRLPLGHGERGAVRLRQG